MVSYAEFLIYNALSLLFPPIYRKDNALFIQPVCDWLRGDISPREKIPAQTINPVGVRDRGT